jgi:hypothetical protein
MGRAKMTSVPTLVTTSQHFYRPEAGLVDDPKYRRFFPQTILQEWEDKSTLMNQSRPDLSKADFNHFLYAQTTADIIHAGGYAGIGDHGEQPGLGNHWEMWGFADALTPLEILHMASTHGARWLGIDQDTGSIEAGKLADLVILNSNPLEDIKNTIDIDQVMKAGQLYKGDTLDQVWPQENVFGPLF